MNFKQALFINLDGDLGGFYEVLPKEVTINLNPDIFQSLTTSRETCFKEVRRVSYQKPDWITGLQKELNSIVPVDSGVEVWTKDLYGVIRDGIERVWSPDKTHIIGTSSGWDSRVMAKAIKELHRKNGDKWLGDTLFIECHGEAEPFKNIMETLGWDWKHYMVINHNTGSDTYFQRQCELKTYADKFDGLVSYPVNQWYDWFVYFGKESEYQYFTGYGANEIDEQGFKKWNSVETYHRWHYDLQLNWFKWPDTVHVFWDESYIKAFWKYQDIKKHHERITELICRYQIPELSHIKRLDYKDIPSYRRMSNWQMGEMIKQYRSSWFGSRVKAVPDPAHDYNSWFGMYCIASITEKLDNVHI